MNTVQWYSTTYALSSSGMVALAAHQVTLNLFLICVYIGDMMLQIAQAFMPHYLLPGGGDSNKLASELKSITEVSYSSSRNTLLDQCDPSALSDVIALNSMVRRLSLTIGVVNMLAVGALNYFGGWLFTSNAEVAAAIRSTTACVMLSTCVHASVCGSEGVLCALKDFRWLFRTYLALSSLFFAGVQLVRRAAVHSQGSAPSKGLRAAWLGFAVFNVVRGALFNLRVQRLLSKAEKKLRLQTVL